MRLPKAFSAPTVSRDQSSLRVTQGFWSRKEVRFNAGNQVVILDSSLTVAQIRKLCLQLYRKHLRDEITARFDRCVELSGGSLSRAFDSSTSNFRLWFPLTLFRTFHQQLPSGKNRDAFTWQEFAAWFKESYSGGIEQQRAFVIDEVTQSLKYSSDGMPRLNGSSSSWLHLGKSEFLQLLEALSQESLDAAIEILCVAQQFSWNKHRHGYDLSSARKHNRQVLERLKAFAIPCAALSSIPDGMSLLNIANAAELTLVNLVQRGSILLPSSQMAYPEACRIAAPHWPWSTIKPHYRPLLQLLISSTDVRDVNDVPAQLRSWLSGFKESHYAYSLTKHLVEPVQHDNTKLSPWPLSGLHGGRRQGAKAQNEVWTPTAIGDKSGSAWSRFAELVIQTSESGRANTRASLRSIVQWATQREIRSPADITIRDLIDPAAPTSKITFKYYLAIRIQQGKISTGTAWGYWHSTAHAFRGVVNALKLAPDALLPIDESPFEAIENPFNISQQHKSSRRRLPNSVHDAMIDVLLEADDTGTPTFRWAKTICHTDWFEWRSHVGGQSETVWCPSRCALLALLLLLPIRAKQARWLDRGLLDEHIWDVDQHRYVVNKHPLRKWRYPDGSTHRQRYGRPSGVLQPLVDPMLEEEELGIFINTNKTQMWDPSSRRGYELPWPNIREDHDSSIASQTAQWLNRPYTLVAKQIDWMNQYHPNPIPISFGDSISDRLQVNDKYLDLLPAFTPLFADLSNEYYRDDSKQTRYYQPVSHNKLYKLFNALSIETEKRLAAEGRNVRLTQTSTSSSSHDGRASIYEIHGLRVAGISRLIEMGVPVSIVQEFIAGHATAVMTMYYSKAEPGAFKARLLEALQNSGAADEWDWYREPLSAQRALWTFNRRYARHRADDILEQPSSWKTVPGGICPVGGSGCHIGIPSEEEDPDKIVRHYSPVEGGCGNCRFFSTGPAFLIHQGLAMNELMLELRLLGRERKALYDALSELAWKDVPDLAEAERHKLVFDKQLIKEKIADFDRKSEPLILEWINRYRMYTESARLMKEWKKFKQKRPPTPGHFLLVAGESDDKLRREVEVRFEKSGDFGLVRNILDAAIIQGGLEKASSLSKNACSQFMDRILRTEDSRHLLMDIRDDRLRHRAAYLMASMVEHLVGYESAQEAIDARTPLPLSAEKRDEFHRWVASTLAEAIPPSQKALPNQSKQRPRRVRRG
ncbi:VPA1269 family protein [Burkholderia cenocepacia]|uniref:VPA1269 family protein n=1 Tax=Burkholderia cenocepacia TaxID=95486 RepID=UPI0015E470DA|nr:VPA1269 family protein [Burkholderia cenocepacia]